MSEAEEVQRWLRPGEVVLWCDRPRPRVLGWPPRSPLSLLIWALLGSLGTMAAVISAVAWSKATGMGAAVPGLVCLALFLLVIVVPVVLMVVGVDLLAPVRLRYVVVREPSGALAAYTTTQYSAQRFVVTRPPEVPAGVERGEVDWGEVHIELIANPHVNYSTPGHQPVHVRWTDVAYPHVLVELTATPARRPEA